MKMPKSHLATVVGASTFGFVSFFILWSFVVRHWLIGFCCRFPAFLFALRCPYSPLNEIHDGLRPRRMRAERL